jgi:Transposase DDE domain
MRLLDDFIVPWERIPEVPHQDQQNDPVHIAEIQAALSRLLPESLRGVQRHGNATILPETLAALAMLCWGWLSDGTINERLAAACDILIRVGRIGEAVSRQGLMQALASCSELLLPAMTEHLAEQVPQLKGHWTAHGKVNVAVDGTKFLAPRSAANQADFAAGNTSSPPRSYATEADRAKAATVQLLATVMWHVGSGLPLRWRIGGSTASERHHAAEMLEELPANARLIADAEYVGDPLWRAMIDSKRSFLIRVGANVRLLKNLGELQFRDGYVYFWTEKAQRRSQPPLVLKLIALHDGRHPVYLVTNDLDLSESEASEIYRQRWGIEVFFRTVKQSAQRRKLTCLTPRNVRTELQWTLLGLWAALFLGRQSLHQNQTPIHRLSPIKVLRALTRTLLAIRDLATAAPPLRELLTQSLRADESTRASPKNSRDYPRKKQYAPAGKPHLTTATATQKRLARPLLK